MLVRTPESRRRGGETEKGGVVIVLAEANASGPPTEELLQGEREVLGRMVDEGFVVAGWRETEGPRVVLVCVAGSVEEATERLQELPMVPEILDFSCRTVAPLRYL